MKKVLLPLGLILAFIISTLSIVFVTNKMIEIKSNSINKEIQNYEIKLENLKKDLRITDGDLNKQINDAVIDIKFIKELAIKNDVIIASKFKKYDYLINQIKIINSKFQDLSGDLNNKISYLEYDFALKLKELSADLNEKINKTHEVINETTISTK